MSFVDVIKQEENAFTYAPASHDCIKRAEKELNVCFASEYANYIQQFGIAIFDGHEFTGLCDGKRLDVVRITQEQRSFNKSVPEDWYVVETLDIDDVVIWQSEAGEIYRTIGKSKPKKISNSLSEYIKK